jgi:spore maturation protein CgeB
MRLLIVGNRSGTNIGGSFERAAVEFGIETEVVESRGATDAAWLLRQWNWRIRGKRPTRLRPFGEEVVRLCEANRPDVLLAMGTAPLERAVLERLRGEGIALANYLTDDPWSRGHRARWFLEALPVYHLLATPRRANLADLRALHSGRVEYLPFAYDPVLSFPDAGAPVGRSDTYDADVVFVGGGDADRVPFLTALSDAGMKVSIYGSYWERFRETRAFTRGQADPQVLRRATTAARLSLCLVRRSNRDGHVMRSFEIPASGGCMLAEDTAEHRAIFGADGEAVAYFRTPGELRERAELLLRDDAERERLTRTAHERIVSGANTYADRLSTLLGWVARAGSSPAGDHTRSQFSGHGA